MFAFRLTDPDGYAERVGAVILFGLAISWAVYVPFLISLTRCLLQVRPRNRLIPAWTVWLMMIPLVNLIWRFVLVYRVASSVEREYHDRRLPIDDDFGRSVGLGWCLLGWLTYLPLILCGGVWNPVCAIFFVLYWAKVSGYATELLDRPASHDRGWRRYNRYDDEDDDRRDRRARGNRYENEP